MLWRVCFGFLVIILPQYHSPWLHRYLQYWDLCFHLSLIGTLLGSRSLRGLGRRSNKQENTIISRNIFFLLIIFLIRLLFSLEASRRYVTLDDGNAGRFVDIFYYRDIDKKEIDLLIIEGDKIYPIEIKRAKEPVNPDKNFGVLHQFKLDVQPGIVLCMSDTLIPYNCDSMRVHISIKF